MTFLAPVRGFTVLETGAPSTPLSLARSLLITKLQQASGPPFLPLCPSFQATVRPYTAAHRLHEFPLT